MPFSYIPFLDGPRKCIGRDLAELEFLVVIATLVRGFDLDVPDTGAEILPYTVGNVTTQAVPSPVTTSSFSSS